MLAGQASAEAVGTPIAWVFISPLDGKLLQSWQLEA